QRPGFYVMLLRPLISSLLPSTTLFRSAVADAMRLDQRDAGPGLGEVRRGRQPREAAADDDDVGAEIAVERRVVGSRAGGVFVPGDRKSTRLNSSHVKRSYAVVYLTK